MDISAYAALKGAERPSPLQYIKAQKAEAQKQGLEAYKAITEGQYKQALAGKVGQETADLQDKAQMRKQLEEAFRDYVGSGDPKKLEEMQRLDMAMKMAWTGAGSVAQPLAQAATRAEPGPEDYSGDASLVKIVGDPNASDLEKKLAEELIRASAAAKRNVGSTAKPQIDLLTTGESRPILEKSDALGDLHGGQRDRAALEAAQAANDIAKILQSNGMQNIQPGQILSDIYNELDINAKRYVKGGGFFADKWKSDEFNAWKQQYIQEKLGRPDSATREEIPQNVTMYPYGTDAKTGQLVFVTTDGRFVYQDGTEYTP